MASIVFWAVVASAFAVLVSGCTLRTRGVATGTASAHVTADAAPEMRLAALVREAIMKPAPAGYASIPPGTQLTSARVIGSRVQLSFNKALLAGGTGRVLEDALKQITNAIDPAIAHIADVDIRIDIEGVPLEQLR